MEQPRLGFRIAEEKTERLKNYKIGPQNLTPLTPKTKEKIPNSIKIEQSQTKLLFRGSLELQHLKGKVDFEN